MTITTQSNKVSYSPTGSQTLYPFSFPIFDEDHLIVYRETAAGVVSTLTLGVDYTVSTATNPGEPIPWPSGGTVTTTSGYSDGKIVIYFNLCFLTRRSRLFLADSVLDFGIFRISNFVFYKRRKARFYFIACLYEALCLFADGQIQFRSGAEFYHAEPFAAS